MPPLLKFAVLAASAASFAADPPLNSLISTFLVELIEFWPSENDVALPVHGNNLLGVSPHEKVLAEDNVVKYAANAKHVADGLRLRRHILYVDDLGCHIARSPASNK